MRLRLYKDRTNCHDNAPIMPVMTQPMRGVISNMCVMVSGTRSLSGTFFSVMTTQQSSPRMPMLVVLLALIALKAYSVTRESKEEKTEMEMRETV